MPNRSHEERVRLKAYEIWLNEGKPEGRDQRHWEMAREAIGYEDARLSTLEPTFGDTKTTKTDKTDEIEKTGKGAAKADTKVSKKVA
jgi:hypothetical protein